MFAGVRTALLSRAAAAAAPVVIGPDTSVSTAWAGAVTQTTFTAAHTTAADTQGTRLVVSTDPTFATGKIYSAYRDTATKTVQHTVSGLTADTAYYFCIEVNGTPKTTKSGSFKTMAAAAGVAQNFLFATISDQSGYNNGKILNHLRTLGLNFAVFNGDLFYNDISTNDVTLFDAAYDGVLAGTYSAPFLRNVPTYYIFDNHDGGGTTYDGTSASRPASLSAFRRRAPNPVGPYTAALDPACYAFTQGRVRFIVTDLHTQSDSTTLLGATQKAWFQSELNAAAAAGLFVFWIHTMTWNSQTWVLGWNGGTRGLERTELADMIIAAGLAGRVAVFTADHHAIQIDNGTNTDYSTGGGLMMPSIGITGLSATEVKIGAPYSEALLFVKSSQGGYVSVTDDGTTLSLAVTAVGQEPADASPAVLATYNFSLPMAPPALPTGVTRVQEYYKRWGSDTNGSNASYSLTLRQQPVAGNLLIMAVACTGPNTGAHPTPSGWTKLGGADKSDTNLSTAIFWKTAGVAEPQTITWTTSGPRSATASVFEISGTVGIGRDAAIIEPAAANTTSVSVTPGNANEWALMFVASKNGSNMNDARSWGGGFAERHTIPMNIPGSNVGAKQLGAAGVTHTGTFTFTGTATNIISRVITLIPTPPAPANTVAPAISGTPQNGLALTVTNGSWSNSPTGYGYQWKRAGTNIGGATGSTYTLVQADVGSTITCTVTATNSGGSASATSTATATVTEMATPSNTVAPAVTGTATTGNVLSATSGTWTSNTAPSYAYQWKRNGSNISAATASTYTLQVADEGTSVLCAVTATNPGGSASANSNTISPTAGAAVSRFDSTTITFDSTSHKMDEN